MPDIVQHHAFGTEVREALAPEIRNDLAEQPYIFALYGPDPWFMYRPVKPRQGRGRRMHTTRTGEFLRALAFQAKTGTAPRETFSYLAGFLCHYALDSHTHPYIIWRTTQTHLAFTLSSHPSFSSTALGWHYAWGSERYASGRSYYVLVDKIAFFMQADAEPM